MGIESYLAISNSQPQIPIEWLAVSLGALFVLSIVDLILRGFALYYAAREEKKPYWFMGLLIVNSLSVLPLVYLLFVRKRKR